MTVNESLAELPGDKGMSEIAQSAERELILNFVLQQCSGNRVAGFADARFRCECVGVMPVRERTAYLNVGEVLVPDEGIDLGLPLESDR